MRKPCLTRSNVRFRNSISLLRLKKVLPKKSIAEYYLNTIYLGQGRYGVETASQYYFNKQLKDLTISECAVLAAIPSEPNANLIPVVFPEENAKRRLMVLDKMSELNMISSQIMIQQLPMMYMLRSKRYHP